MSKQQTSYGRVGRFLNSHPWAIQEHVLDTMVEIVRMRASGIELTQEEIRARIGAGRVEAARPGASQPIGTQIGVLPLQGVIAPKMNMFTEISGGTSLEEFMHEFRELRDDASVSAIVCDIDSPGGSVFLLAEAWAEIFDARAVKPLVAVVRPSCGSAALYIASAFEEIVCTPSGEIGSIGCYMVHEDWSKANELAGVKPTYIAYGRYKVEGNPDEPLGDEALQFLQSRVDQCGQEFEAAVAKGRGVSVKVVREQFGQGRMLTAKEAKAVGLVDRVDTIENTLMRLAGGRRGRSGGASAERASVEEIRADAARLDAHDGDAAADAPVEAAEPEPVAPVESALEPPASSGLSEVEAMRLRLENEERASH